MVCQQGTDKREGRDGRKGREGREGRETEALEPIAELSIRDPVSGAKHIRVESLSLFPARMACAVFRVTCPSCIRARASRIFVQQYEQHMTKQEELCW